MDKIKLEQQLQESEYSFPYHYISEYENSFSLAKSWSWGMQYISAIEFILHKVGEIEFNSICDVGTGDGRFVRELAKKFPQKKIMGIDYSDRAISLAKALNPDLSFECVNIIHNSLNQKYDVLTLIEVFEHIPKELCDQFVKSLPNLLKKEGVLLLTVPHTNKKIQDKHFQHFDKNKIHYYFTNYFTIEEVIPFENISRHLLKKLIRILIFNNFFILNNKRLLNQFYHIYKKKFFFAAENTCGRLFVKMKRK